MGFAEPDSPYNLAGLAQLYATWALELRMSNLE